MLVGIFVVDFMVANFDKLLHMHRIIIIDNFLFDLPIINSSSTFH